jgi:UDP-N-acetylglucosamine diphosphorylase / glucose-1-phosphate thymidylyltransferase / UDP-N-acetylgalactosamine diphosphorylase / glucosamine-1-phosphate N-acetyltransferase / galactosamine-1-phosphate N-acetyltransferase
MLTLEDFFDLSTFVHRELFPAQAPVWTPLDRLKEYMAGYVYPGLNPRLVGSGVPLTEHLVLYRGGLQPAAGLSIEFGDATAGKLVVRHGADTLAGASVLMAGSVFLGEKIAIGAGVLVESGAMIKSPAIIGDRCEIRQGAYLRGGCLTGQRCVLGHTTEIKNTIFLDDAKAGHFAYLGDSILGNATNLGAGTKFANLRFLPGNVTLFFEGKNIDTGRRKLGAILGDGCQTGCNSVTSPGTLMARESVLMPNATARGGYHKSKSILR